MAKEFTVRWEMQITADSPKAAADQVWNTFLSKQADMGEATQLDVYDTEEADSDSFKGYEGSYLREDKL